jgi:hypothetical protein
MGLTAILSSSSSSASSAGVSSATSLLSPVGVGIGGIFVAVTLIAVLAYLDLFDASELYNGQIRTMLIATVLPLALTFGAIVLFESLAVI